jgi:hypothetical protein
MLFKDPISNLEIMQHPTGGKMIIIKHLEGGSILSRPKERKKDLSG